MTTTYRYGIQERDQVQQAFLADVSVTDPSQELIAHNAVAMGDLHLSAQIYARDMLPNPLDPALRRAAVFTIVDGPNGSIQSVSYAMFQVHLDALVAQFNATIGTSIPVQTGKHHKK